MVNEGELSCDPQYVPKFKCQKGFLTALLGSIYALENLDDDNKPDHDIPIFDTDSEAFAIDPCALATIWKTPNLFLKGDGGQVPIHGKGTLTCMIKDDEGTKQRMVIKDAYLVPEAPISLLSCPQQGQGNERNNTVPWMMQASWPRALSLNSVGTRAALT